MLNSTGERRIPGNQLYASGWGSVATFQSFQIHLEGMQHMNRSIVGISLATIVIILLVSLLINRWLLRRLWKPFYNTLHRH